MKARPIRIDGDVAYVPLTRGYVAVIDTADVPLVEAWNWAAEVGPWTVYARRNERRNGGRTVRMHRAIMAAPAEMEVDHRNGDGLDNRRSNLRLATRAENAQNQRLSQASTSGFKGVSRHKHKGKWEAYIKHAGKLRRLGYYSTPEAAHAAYVAAATELRGSYANDGHRPVQEFGEANG